MVCRHKADVVEFPDRTRVLASGWFERAAADAQIISAWQQAQAGKRVEVACIGGHGRTGTVLACMAVLAGIPADEAVSWVRARYCVRAVQEPAQQYWMERFAERHAG